MELTPEQMVWHSTLMELLQRADLDGTKAIAFCDAAADAFRARFPQVIEPKMTNAELLARSRQQAVDWIKKNGHLYPEITGVRVSSASTVPNAEAKVDITHYASYGYRYPDGIPSASFGLASDNLDKSTA